MQSIIAILSLTLLMWVEAASAQTRTYSVSVSRHSDTPELSAGTVEGILTMASQILQRNPGHACNVAFKLKGPVRTFTSPDKEAFGDLDIKDLHGVDSDLTVDFRVKVVEKIGFCRGTFGTFTGCAFPPEFHSIIVVHPEKNQGPPAHVLWAHEFGHVTGLGHRKDEHALMRCGGVTNDSVRLDEEECRCFLGGPEACPLPPPFFC